VAGLAVSLGKQRRYILSSCATHIFPLSLRLANLSVSRNMIAPPASWTVNDTGTPVLWEIDQNQQSGGRTVVKGVMATSIAKLASRAPWYATEHVDHSPPMMAVSTARNHASNHSTDVAGCAGKKMVIEACILHCLHPAVKVQRRRENGIVGDRGKLDVFRLAHQLLAHREHADLDVATAACLREDQRGVLADADSEAQPAEQA